MSAFNASVGASSALTPHYTTPATTAETPPSSAPTNDWGQRITQWLASSAARPYDGSWVLLNEALEVADSDASARELAARRTGSEPIVYVLPPRTRFG